MKLTSEVFTSRDSHNSHYADYRRIYWNKSGLNLFQNDANNRQDHNYDVQLVPPAEHNRITPSK